MARHLCDAGYSVSVFNRTARQDQNLRRAFGAYAGAFAQTCRRTLGDIVITMLTDVAAVRAVIVKARTVFSRTPKKSLVWIQMSTIDIESTKAFAKQAEAHGIVFVDCPVTGSKKQVESAELILLLGAEAGSRCSSFARFCRAWAKTIIEAGPIGNGIGARALMQMNLIVAQMTTALAEAVALAELSRIKPDLIFQVNKNSPALNCGYFTIKGPALLNQDFLPRLLSRHSAGQGCGPSWSKKPRPEDRISRSPKRSSDF